MKKLKQGCLAVLRSPEFPLLLLWVTVIVAHFFFSTTNYDDAWFMQILAGDKATFANWSQFLIFRYHNWSSRTLIEGLLILLARFPVLWKIFDSLICIVITILFARLANPERSRMKNIILVAACLLFPVAVIYEVGFIATSLNYSWPFAAALFAISPAVKQFQGREVRRWEYAAAFPALFLACFQELLCATVVLALLGSLVYRVFFEKRSPKYQIGCLVICAVMLVYALTCPGNDVRSVQETATWLPEYAELSLFQKVELGFSSMIKTIFLKLNVFILVFCLVLAVAVWMESKKVWHRIVACVPFLFTLIFGALGEKLSQSLPFVASLRNSVGNLGTGFSILSPATWLPDLIFVLVLCAILLSLRFAVRDTKQYCFLFFLLFLGAASRIALGLSPTVWASGERICAFLYVGMAVVMASLLCRTVRRVIFTRS